MIEYERHKELRQMKNESNKAFGEVTFFGTMSIELEFEKSNGSSTKSLSQTFELRESQIAKEDVTAD